MKQAFFYLLTEIEPNFDASQDLWQQNKQVKLTQREQLACWLAVRYFQTRKKVLIFCENEMHAERIDEALWAYQPERFIAHDLVSKSKNHTTLIQIGWPGHRSLDSRDILIYLADEFSDVTTFFNSVIDFVPAIEQEKEVARIRYKQFREMGFHLKTGPLPEKFLANTQD
ncbi:DNA polymerase III subunit chi [Thorsellia kenyensis]|uniref:DNA polymerase III subunit chi n=1 Tax=Thorsellia kenyensis TaxID=1549888 RepID=A0ABV6C7B2_9GAMM